MALKPTTAIKQNKLGQIVTPKGSALFVSVPNVSTYDPEKQEASIVLSPEDYATFKADVDALIAKYQDELVVDTSSMDMPVRAATDKDGNPTGDMIVKAKTSIKYPAKLYNAKAVVFSPPAGFSVANRSTIKLAVSAELVSTRVYKGLVLRLNSVMIISSNASNLSISASPWVGTNPFTPDSEGDFEVVTDTFGSSTGGDDDWV